MGLGEMERLVDVGRKKTHSAKAHAILGIR